jgi:hypothetical protein
VSIEAVDIVLVRCTICSSLTQHVCMDCMLLEPRVVVHLCPRADCRKEHKGAAHKPQEHPSPRIRRRGRR